VASHAEKLWRVLTDAEGLFRVHDIPPQPSFSFDEPVGVPGHTETVEERERWLAERELVLARGIRSRAVSATALAAVDDERDDPSDRATPGSSHVAGETPAGEPVLGPGRRAGTAIGRAVHALLQTIDLDDPASGLDWLASTVASGEGLAAEAPVVAALARSVLDSPTVAEARRSARRWRELYVAAPIGERILEGYVDLVFEDDDGGLVVVDYKTDRARSDADLDEAMSRYRLQGAAYAVALGAVLGRPVDRCVFVFARPGGAVERTVDDLPAAREEVLTRLAS
jgi:ATP-dependent helicase/nuclease subunit A